jgi:Protein of unknown function, DUF488
MLTTLFTLGYEGLTIEAFIARLQTAQAKTVVDVREPPLSRKKGFSNSAFCAGLSAHGMAYLHAPALGCPKPIRNQYTGRWQLANLHAGIFEVHPDARCVLNLKPWARGLNIAAGSRRPFHFRWHAHHLARPHHDQISASLLGQLSCAHCRSLDCR